MDREFILDRQYVVIDGEIVIVDEFTGRIAEGRKWRAGIHQAVEAKEGVEVDGRNRPGRPDHGAGFLPALSACGWHDRHRGQLGRRVAKIYGLRVVPIPTNRPAIRQRLPDRVFGTSDIKWETIADEVAEFHATGPAGADRHPLDR